MVRNLGGHEVGGVESEVRRFVGHAVGQRVAVELIAVNDAEHGEPVARLPERVRQQQYDDQSYAVSKIARPKQLAVSRKRDAQCQCESARGNGIFCVHSNRHYERHREVETLVSRLDQPHREQDQGAPCRRREHFGRKGVSQSEQSRRQDDGQPG